MASRANNAGSSNLNNGHSAKGLDASTSERPNNTDLLVPELFGFEPIHLLDDIFNVAQDAVIFSTEAMDKFLTGWSGRRREVRAEQGLPPLKAPNGEEWTGEEEIEQGLVSLQTLLDTHVDEVFDMFEVWALRNVFKVPDDAEQVVLPHHKGLDLNVREGKEAELLAEIEELRRKKENMHKLHSLYTRAVDASAQQRTVAETELKQVQFIADTLPKSSSDTSATIVPLAALPKQLEQLRIAISDMPSEEDIREAGLNKKKVHEQSMRTSFGRREWEESKGYEVWALEKAVLDGIGEVEDRSKDVGSVGMEWRKQEERGGRRGLDALLDGEEDGQP